MQTDAQGREVAQLARGLGADGEEQGVRAVREAREARPCGGLERDRGNYDDPEGRRPEQDVRRPRDPNRLGGGDDEQPVEDGERQKPPRARAERMSVPISGVWTRAPRPRAVAGGEQARGKGAATGAGKPLQGP